MKYVEDFEAALKLKIAEIESRSSIEIVPVHFNKAKSYIVWSVFVAAIFAAIFYEILWVNVSDAWLTGALYLKILSFILIFCGFCFLFTKTKLLFLFIPQQSLMEACSTRASLTFLSEAIFETRDRSGILVCVFEFEKKVIVLADKGFRALVKEDYWKDLAQKLAKDFNRNKVGDEFFEALHYLEKEVAPHFPRRLDDINELGDDLIKR